MEKGIFLTLILAAIMVSCNSSNNKKPVVNTESEEKKEKLSIIGAWERTSFYNYDEMGEITDSFASSQSNRHIKIFTPSKVMWCRNVASDSTEWFGYGTYTVTDTLLTEVLEYGSKKMGQYIAKNPEFVFRYSLSETTYSQIQMDAEGHPLFAENYIRIE